jgi:hypothetical protein
MNKHTTRCVGASVATTLQISTHLSTCHPHINYMYQSTSFSIFLYHGANYCSISAIIAKYSVVRFLEKVFGCLHESVSQASESQNIHG